MPSTLRILFKALTDGEAEDDRRRGSVEKRKLIIIIS